MPRFAYHIWLTGCDEYTSEFDNTGYNKGRLAKLVHEGKTTYISFSQTGKIGARNSSFQSVTTAFTQYYSDAQKGKICFYFLPYEGNIETEYFRFTYRLMATAGIEFLNSSMLENEIIPFNSVDDIIAVRNKLRNRNKSNNSTYITKNFDGDTEIYGKTYGASKKETALICFAISSLVQPVTLYEIREQELTTLPKPERTALELQNVKIIETNTEMEKNYLNNTSLRSPRFNYNLLEKLGMKKCGFCKCMIPELISGAHIWPVSDIKQKQNLEINKKIEYATDGDNGIWLCENHHRMLDRNVIKITEDGKLQHTSKLNKQVVEFIKEITPITELKSGVISGSFVSYLKKRNQRLLGMTYIYL